jgi:hypothetical protein
VIIYVEMGVFLSDYQHEANLNIIVVVVVVVDVVQVSCALQ